MAGFASSQGRSVNPVSHTHFSIMKCIALLYSAISFVVAHELNTGRGVELSSFYQELEQRGEIHVDIGSPPVVPREAATGSTSNSATASPTSSTQGSTITTGPSATPDSSSKPSSTVSLSSTTTDPTTLPSPFDTSLGNNFTVQLCPTFFNNYIINNATFKNCMPVSVLLQNSYMFLKAFKSATYLDKVFDSACGASLATCSPLMASIADQLTDDANCGQDYRKQNPLVMQAYAGLLAYEPVYTATCIENNSTKNYCFVDAVVNNTNAADLYPYYLALGTSLPDTAQTQPSCTPCLQQTMNIFAGYAGQKSQPLSKTYTAAALQINSACGVNFVGTNGKTASAVKSAASRSRVSDLAVCLTTATLSLLFL